VLVSLAADEVHHTFYVVPRDVVYATVRAHQISPAKPPVRLGPVEYAFYEDRWELMEQPSWAAPWRMRPWVQRALPRIEWPDGHGGPRRTPSPTAMTEHGGSLLRSGR